MDARTAGRERRRGRILAAAERLFAEHGFLKTTVDEIAAAAGVSKGLVYAHYASKEDLLAAVWAQLVAGWTEATELGTKFSPDAVADSIGSFLDASLRYARANPMLRRIIAQDPGSLLPHQREGVAAFARGYRSRLEPVLARGVRSGELRPDLDVARTAELIWLLHFALVRELFVASDRGGSPDGDALVRSAVDLVVAGLRRAPGRGRRGAR
jgi:AcrR family transcriptional regulator